VSVDRTPCRSILGLPVHGASEWRGSPSGDHRSAHERETLSRQTAAALEEHCSRILKLKYFPFLSNFLHIPRKIFAESSHVLSDSIYRQTNIKHIDRKFPARPCCLLL